MPQQQQSNVVKPQKVDGLKLGMPSSSAVKMRLYKKTHPSNPKKKSSPSLSKVEKSVKKSMGY